MEYTGGDNLEAMRAAVRYNESLLQLVRGNARRVDVLVDFGAGIGTFADSLRREGYSVLCVEQDVRQASMIRELGLPAVTSLQDLPPDSADVVYTFNVLEHIEADQGILTGLFSLLKPGGRLIVYVPAFPLLYSKMDHMVGHVRRYRRSEIKSKLIAAGFCIEALRYADSIGFLASLAYRLLPNATGNVSPTSVAFYDRWIFPLSQLADRALCRLGGKNLVAIAAKPGLADSSDLRRQ